MSKTLMAAAAAKRHRLLAPFPVEIALENSMMNRPHWPARWQQLRAALALAVAALLWGLNAPAHAAVLISQVYGGGGNSGAPLQNDFVELRNTGAAPVSLAGWSIQYASATGTSWTNSVNLSGSIPANGYFLVQLSSGGANGVALPLADQSGAINMSASAGKLALFNITTVFSGGTCPVGNAALVDFVGYGTTANCFEGAGAAPAPSNTLAVIRAAAAWNCTDTNTNSADFTAATPTPRNSTTVVDCAGGGGGGGGGTPPVAAAIYTIQGSGATSPMVGVAVITSGVVTKLLNNGFFMQDLLGDGNPATSDGIFVFTSTAPPAAVVVGNLVQVTGTVVEFSSGTGTAATPLTEINSVTAVSLLGSGYTITPTLITLPLAAGDSLERFEGMLVRIAGTLTVQQNFFQARFGQLTVGAGGRHETPTNRYRAGSAAAIALADLQARGRLLLDDGSSLQNINPTAYFFANGVPRAGDVVSNLVGVIDFGLATATVSGAGLYRLQPTEAPVLAIGNARSTAPTAARGNVKLGSMNVLNFFTTFTNGETASGQTGQGCTVGNSTSAGNCRGADNIEEFNRQRAKIVRALAGLNADAVGLMEIQNNVSVAAQNLVDALNTYLGASLYAVVPAPATGTGTDAIRVAMIYKPGKLILLGGAVSDPDAINNRPPMAQTFTAANGERFTLVVNHLKSKGGCPSAGAPDAAGNLDIGDGQGCWNAQRVLQAQRLRTFVAQVQASSGSNDVLLVGDFNAYGQEDPIFDLTSNGYIDQSGRYTALAYSYVFDGTAGRLDHAISSAAMSSKIASAAHWHINADEQLAYDYNLEFKPPLCATCAPDPYNADPFRSSDHDPVLVGLNLYKTFNGTAGRDIIVGSAGDDIIYGGPGADTLTGGGGNNIFLYTSIRDAGDTITDFVPGKDVLDVGALLTSLGYTGSDPIADGWLRFVALSRNATSVEIDADGPGPGVSRSLVTLLGVNSSTLVGARDLKLATPPDSRTGPRRMTVAR